MLSPRYQNDGIPKARLNAAQISMRDSINKKVQSKIYSFESVACGVCGSTNSELLAEKDRYGLYFPVVVCKDCGLVYTSPRMTLSSYAQFYDSEYRQLYHGKEHPIADLYKENLDRGRKISNYLREAGIEIRGKRVLEVGCAAGGILAYFRDHFDCQVKGCDFGSEGVDFGVTQQGLDLEVGTLDSINIPWKPDIIIYSHVMEHVLDLKQECARIHKTLDDLGVVYIEVPSTKGIRQQYDGDFLKLLQNAHTYHFTLASLTNLMKQCGFSLVLGNEYTRSVFKRQPNIDPNAKLENDYESVMKFLRTTESKVNSLPRKARRFAIACIDSIGLTATVKKLVKR